MIPSDKLDEYIKLLEEAEKKREPFRQYMLNLNQEFEDYLYTMLSDRTVQKHTSIVFLFIDFICKQTDVESIEEITRGMVNTHFKKWWKRKVWDSTTPDQFRVSLKKFFKFLVAEEKIVNERALKALQ